MFRKGSWSLELRSARKREGSLVKIVEDGRCGAQVQVQSGPPGLQEVTVRHTGETADALRGRTCAEVVGRTTLHRSSHPQLWASRSSPGSTENKGSLEPAGPLPPPDDWREVSLFRLLVPGCRGRPRSPPGRDYVGRPRKEVGLADAPDLRTRYSDLWVLCVTVSHTHRSRRVAVVPPVVHSGSVPRRWVQGF